jgi:Poxvirus Late Transcription Factor VLTF3 like
MNGSNSSTFNSIFGIKPPIMNEELLETLCVLFIEIQKPWAIHCPPNRTIFLNYTYTLYQLCVLLDQTQYIPYIVQLKDDLKEENKTRYGN